MPCSEYGWTILGAGIAPFIGLLALGGQVMEARKKYGVDYPNLYAVPGYHKDADAFNRVQRGHQNALESVSIP
jgi:glutathione S-transferase